MNETNPSALYIAVIPLSQNGPVKLYHYSDIYYDFLITNDKQTLNQSPLHSYIVTSSSILQE